MDADVRFGKPCLAGTRLDIATLLAALASGDSFDAVQENYRITREQLLSALQYVAHVLAHLPPVVQRTV